MILHDRQCLCGNVLVNRCEKELQPLTSLCDNLSPAFTERAFDCEDDAVHRHFVEVFDAWEQEVGLPVNFFLRSTWVTKCHIE